VEVRGLDAAGLNATVGASSMTLGGLLKHLALVEDEFFDVARAVENPEAPDYIHPALDSGDGMHLNDKGAQAMANAVDPETLAL
jgi:lysophospholipase L1-like esterase